jgi:hypothetical protein
MVKYEAMSERMSDVSSTSRSERRYSSDDGV